MKRAAFAFAVLVAMAVVAHAKPEDKVVGGSPMKCSSDPADKAKIMDGLDGARGIEVIRFDSAQTVAFLAKFNAAEPATTIKADDMFAFRSSEATLLAFDIGPDFCISSGLVPTKTFNQIVSDSIGSGT